MREILFRGKAINGDWVYGNFDKLERHDDSGLYNYCIIQPSEVIATSVNPDTVGQYIDVDDENGTKIFEGDIIEFFGTIGEIRYYGNGFVLVTEHYIEDSIYGRSHAYGIEVIGNIYDNPELVISRTTQTF